MNRCGSDEEQHLGIVRGTQAKATSPFDLTAWDQLGGMAAFGLALLQLEADDEAMEEELEAMEEEELQEEEEQLNMLMHFTMAAGAAAAAAADAPASRASKRRVVQRGANVHQPSHCHAVSCRDAIVRCRLPSSAGLPGMLAEACAQRAASGRMHVSAAVAVQPGILAKCQSISLCTSAGSKSWPHPVHRSQPRPADTPHGAEGLLDGSEPTCWGFSGAHVHVGWLNKFVSCPRTRSAIKQVDPRAESLASPLHAPSPSPSPTFIPFANSLQKISKDPTSPVQVLVTENFRTKPVELTEDLLRFL